MTVYNVLTGSLIHNCFSFGKALTKTLEGDEIRLGSHNFTLDPGTTISKKLYITGKSNSQFYVKQHQVGLQLDGTAQLIIDRVSFQTSPQSNAIVNTDLFDGELIMKNVSFHQKKTRQKRDYYQNLNLTHGRRIVLENCDIDSVFIDTPDAIVTIKNSVIGNLEHAASIINAATIEIDESTLENISLGSIGENSYTQLRNIKNKGGVILNYAALAENMTFIPYAKARASKQYPDTVTYLSTGEDAAINLNGIKNEPKGENIPIKYRAFAFANAKIEFTRSKVSACELPSFMENCNLEMKNITDDNAWNTDDQSQVTAQNTTSQLYHTDPKTQSSSALDELNSLIGIPAAKNAITSMVNLAKTNKIRKERGLPVKNDVSLHMIFEGNAGTGKTTAARLFGRALYEQGIMPTSTFVSVKRRNLVGKFQGHTADITAKVVKSALGGVLFIDEAYSLMLDEHDSFGAEAVQELLQDMEDYRDNLIVILAGYTSDMNRFLQTNQGLSSRIPNRITFEDLTTSQIVKVIELQLKQAGNVCNQKTLNEIAPALYQKTGGNGNGRWARTFVQEMIVAQGNRLSELDITSLPTEQLTKITDDDIYTAARVVLANHQTEQIR